MNRTGLDDRRTWLIGGALLALLLVAVGWLFFIHPKLSSAETLRSQRISTDQQNTALAGQVASLKQQYAHLGTQRKALTALLGELPPSNALTDFLRQVNALADADKVTIRSLTNATPTAAVSSSAPAPADSGESSSSSSTPSPTPTEAATSAAPAEYSTAVSLETVGTAFNQGRFLHDLEHGRRAVLVNSVQVTDNEEGGTTMTSALTIFSAPMSTAQLSQLNKLFSRDEN